jgi:hypothetical protein
MRALLLAVRQSAASPIKRIRRKVYAICLHSVRRLSGSWTASYLIAAGDEPERYSSAGWEFAVDYRDGAHALRHGWIGVTDETL